MWMPLGVLALSSCAAALATGGAASDGRRARRRPGAPRALDGDGGVRGLLGSLVAELIQRLGRLGWVRKACERMGEGASAGSCERQVPELLDILALGLSAGLSFDASLELYCSRSDAELAAEASAALRSWQMGLASRTEALEALAVRTRSPSLARFARAVAEALAFGSPLAVALERQAATLREEQRAETQRRVEEVPVRMLVPLGTLVVPAMLLAILGPLLAAAFSG